MLHGDKMVPDGVPASRDNMLQRAWGLVVLLLCVAGVRWLVQLGG